MVIGVGPSGKPSGLPPLVTQELSWDRLDDGPKNTFKSGLTLTWGPTGALDVGGQPPDLGPDATSAESWLGHHLVTFP